MSSHLTDFVNPVTRPLNDLQGHLSRMADLHREAHTRFRSHGTALTASGFDAFVGVGANAFSDAIGQYITSSEQHMQLLDHAVTIAANCVNDIMRAVGVASSISLHEDMVGYVLGRLNQDTVIQDGGDAVMAILADMKNTLNSVVNTGGDFFGHIFTFHPIDALHDVSHELSNMEHLASDAMNLLEDVGWVLTQWADDVASAVLRFKHAIESLILSVPPYIPHVTELKHAGQEKAVKEFLKKPTLLNLSKLISSSEAKNSPITIIKVGPNTILVALAGTDSGHPEWVTNLPNAIDSGGGDKNNPYLLDINAAIEQYMQENGMSAGTQVIVAGHSMGGIEAEYLAENNGTTNYTVKQVITFGSPQIGPQRSDVMYHQYFNEFDPITLLSWYGFTTGNVRQGETLIPGDPNQVVPQTTNVGNVLNSEKDLLLNPIKDHEYTNIHNTFLAQRYVHFNDSISGPITPDTTIDYYAGTPQNQWVDWYRTVSTLSLDIGSLPSPNLPDILNPSNFFDSRNISDCTLMPPSCVP